MTTHYVITDYTPGSSSGFTWLKANASRDMALNHARQIAAETPVGVTRLIRVEVPRNVPVGGYVESLDDDDALDAMPSIWEQDNRR